MSARPEIVFAEERRQSIARLLEQTKRVAVADLCERFKVSAATIRSDLREMQQAGLLTRTHGGAIPRSQTAYEPTTNDKLIQNFKPKQRIAQAAAKLIEDGDTILLDTGTTSMELAECLGRRRDMKVVTNDLEIARLLEDSPHSEVIVLGGMLRSGFHCTVGHLGLMNTSSLRVDKAFMGANGFSLEAGATTPSVQHAETKMAMMAMANQVFLLCDSSKIGKAAFARFAQASDFDVLITEHLDPSLNNALQELNVEVIETG